MDAFFLQFCPEDNIIWEKRMLFGQKRILSGMRNNPNLDVEKMFEEMFEEMLTSRKCSRLTIPSILEATANDDELQDDKLD